MTAKGDVVRGSCHGFRELGCCLRIDALDGSRRQIAALVPQPQGRSLSGR